MLICHHHDVASSTSHALYAVAHASAFALLIYIHVCLYVVNNSSIERYQSQVNYHSSCIDMICR